MPVAVGDLHLDARIADIPDAPERVLKTLEQPYELARREGDRDVILLGDIFDNADPAKRTVDLFVRFLLDNDDVNTHVLMGNHDHDDVENHSLQWVRTLHQYKLLRTRVYIKPRVVKLGDGESYFFCPHPYLSNQPKGVRYSFGHFGYAGARGDNGFVIKNGNAPKGRWVLGDYHTAQRGKNYAYPGSLCQVNYHESADKYIAHITDKVRMVQVRPHLRLGRAKITSAADLEALDPTVFWSVNEARDADLPADWAGRYPHVVKRHAERTSSKRQRVLMQQVANADPLEGLEEDLLAQGATDRQVERAYELLGRPRAA